MLPTVVRPFRTYKTHKAGRMRLINSARPTIHILQTSLHTLFYNILSLEFDTVEWHVKTSNNLHRVIDQYIIR